MVSVNTSGLLDISSVFCGLFLPERKMVQEEEEGGEVPLDEIVEFRCAYGTEDE